MKVIRRSVLPLYLLVTTRGSATMIQLASACDSKKGSAAKTYNVDQHQLSLAGTIV